MAYQGWAIVEIMGHVREAGRVDEVTQFGAVMIRVDIPLGLVDSDGYITKFYGGASICCLSPVEESIARRAAVRMGDPRPTAPMGYLPAPIPEPEPPTYGYKITAVDIEAAPVGGPAPERNDERQYAPGDEITVPWNDGDGDAAAVPDDVDATLQALCDGPVATELRCPECDGDGRIGGCKTCGLDDMSF